MKYWENITVGQRFETGSTTIEASDIIEFASQFDPQPYHLDPVFAETSIFGGHCASGWQVCALMMRLLVDTFNNEGLLSGGSPGVSSLRWLKPVLAGDTLSASIVVDSKDENSGTPGYGLIAISINVCNQHAKDVIVLTTDIMIAQKTAQLP